MSQRRILLIDSDPVFHRLLDEQLRRYRFQVEVDPDGADALGRAANAPPALLIVAVDEPDKQGYSLCNKAKKGPLAKVPVVLATATISPEAFAAHRKLKLHADEYLDKRSLSNDELLGKIDNLIGLGDPVSDEGSGEIALDGDDVVEVASDELILEEGGAEDDFEPQPTAIGTSAMTMDALLDAETDAAFAMLTGPEDMGRSQPVPIMAREAVEAAEAAEAAQAAEAIAIEHVEHVEHVEHGTRSGRAGRATLRGESEASDEVVPIEVDLATDGAAASEAAAAGAQAAETAASVQATRTAQAAVEPQRDDEAKSEPLAALDAALQAAQRSIGEGPEDMGAVGTVGVIGGGARQPRRRGRAAAPADAPEAATSEKLTSSGSSEQAEPATQRHAFLKNAPTTEISAPRDFLPLTGDASAAPVMPLGGPIGGPGSRPGSRPGSEPGTGKRARSEIDLGLDEVAERADREQSGVFDRRTMQRVADLERENHQLKAELGRVRSSATHDVVGKTPIEREFFALREAMVAKDKELLGLRDSMAVREKELTTERDRLRQLQHAKSNLETKNQELESRLFEESEKGSAADSTQRAVNAQLAALRQEIDARAQAAAAAESARANAERELTAERQARMALAAKMEYTVGAERASLEEYYRTELASARANAEAEKTAAAVAAVTEADTAHELAIDRLTAAHRSSLDEREALQAQRLAERGEAHAAELRKLAEERAAELAAALAAAREEQANAAEAAEQRWRDEAEALRRRHAAELERVAGAHELALVSATGEREHLAGAVATTKEQHAAELELQRAEHAQQLKQIEEHHGRALEAARAEHALELRRTQSESESVVRSAQQASQQELLSLKLQHEAAMAQEQQLLADRTRAHIAAMDERTAAHDAAIRSLEGAHAADAAKLTERSREKGELQRELETRTQQMLVVSEEAARLREQVRQATADGQRDTLDLRNEHQAALAKLRADAELAVTKAKIDGEAALAKAKVETETAVARTRSDGEAALAKLRGEHAAALTRTRAEGEAALAKLRSEQASAQEAQHHEHLEALENESERRTAELRTMQEQAEQGVELLRQQHQAALESALQERDELRAGLTSAREQLRRLEDEMGQSRQEVAVREQELELHTQALAERDQRIGELRGELEAMETESSAYQEQVLKAYQKIKQEEARVARAKKAVAIALTVLDDESGPGQ